MLVRRYEEADVTQLQERLATAFEPGDKLLELGCGSGRDAAFMHAKGFDVLAVDGTPTMVEHAVRLHPELVGRVKCFSLPEILPYTTSSFDGVYALAVLMHLTRRGIEESVAEVYRVLKQGGSFLFSVPSARGDVNTNDRDDMGRLFSSLALSDWITVCETCGFHKLKVWENSDGLGRPEVRWSSLLFGKGR